MNRSLESPNIHRFVSRSLYHENDQWIGDKTVTVDRIISLSNLTLSTQLSRLSSFTVNSENIDSFITKLGQQQIYPKIRKLHCHFSIRKFLCHIQIIFRKFPYLRSISIGNVDRFDLVKPILDSILRRLSNRSLLIHLCISGSYFNEIYSMNPNEEDLKTFFSEIFLRPYHDDRPFSLSFTLSKQSVDIWF